jgi:hypothetical protein
MRNNVAVCILGVLLLPLHLHTYRPCEPRHQEGTMEVEIGKETL